MKILCAFGKYNYGCPARGVGYEYANFIPALESLGHEVIFFESLNKDSYLDYSDLNRKLIKAVEEEQPELIFCVLMGYEIWIETLQYIRSTFHTNLVHWATDDSWKYDQFSRYMASYFDVYATTYSSAIEKAKNDGHDCFYLSQWAANSENFREPKLSIDCEHDVTFIGTQYGNRKKWVDQLIEHGIKVECFGYGWPNGPISAEEIPNIINTSKISLNFGDSGLFLAKGKLSRSRQIKARVFEIPGAGGFLATEAAENLEKYYENEKEVLIFDDIDDLANKINYYLSHPNERDAIVRSGFKKTVQQHSYEHRFNPLLDLAISKNSQVRVENDGVCFASIDDIENMHQLTISLRCMRIIVLIPCVLIWGKNRGPRAARKFLFELSWRFFGKKTYSASGWPGRLFYEAS